MSIGKTIKKVLIDKNITMTALAEQMGKPRQTVANTFFKDNMRVDTSLEYLNALGCGLYVRDEETGIEYKVLAN